MPSLWETALTIWSDEVAERLQGTSGPIRLAAVQEEIPKRSLFALRDVLDGRTERLIQDRRVAVCYAQRPMLYPESVPELAESQLCGTVVVQTLENYSKLFLDIQQHFERPDWTRVHVSSYISRATADRFDWHIDDWHVVVLQLSGVKVFYFDSGHSEVLHKGDSVVIRKGVSHRAATESESEASVHLSIALHN